MKTIKNIPIETYMHIEDLSFEKQTLAMPLPTWAYKMTETNQIVETVARKIVEKYENREWNI